jgi:alkyldihydroxyacetonephosphate synthase
VVDAALDVVTAECARATLADPALAERWLLRRNEVHSLEELARGGVVADTIEVAASWRTLPTLYTDAIGALRALGPTIAASAHQSHAYPDGACLYFTFAGVAQGDAASGVEGATGPGTWAAGALDAYYRAAWDTVSRVTLAHGGSLSHHHGIGINRARHLPTALGSGFTVLQAVKDALDPDGILNPGKLGLASPFGPAPWP